MPARWAPAARRWLCGLTAAASPHPPRGTTRSCWSSTTRTRPPWPAPTPPSSTPELRQRHCTLFLSVSERRQLSRGNSSSSRRPCREGGPADHRASLPEGVGADVSPRTRGPRTPRMQQRPRSIRLPGAPGGQPSSLEGPSLTPSALLTKLTSFQLLGAQDQIKKLAHKECLVVRLRILVQSCSYSVSSSAHRVSGCQSISDAERCRKVTAHLHGQSWG